MIIYMFQCHFPKSSPPLPLPQSPKDCSILLYLFCYLAYRVIILDFLWAIHMHTPGVCTCAAGVPAPSWPSPCSQWWPWRRSWSRGGTALALCLHTVYICTCDVCKKNSQSSICKGTFVLREAHCYMMLQREASLHAHL